MKLLLADKITTHLKIYSLKVASSRFNERCTKNAFYFMLKALFRNLPFWPVFLER